MEHNCICCGTCCQKYQPWLTVPEVNSIAGRLGLTPDEFIAQYTDHRWPGTESFLLIHRDGACVFLYTTPDTQLSLCRIHAFKPDSCRAWAAGLRKSECQNGLKKFFGIIVEPSGELKADEAALAGLAARKRLIEEL